MDGQMLKKIFVSLLLISFAQTSYAQKNQSKAPLQARQIAQEDAQQLEVLKDVLASFEKKNFVAAETKFLELLKQNILPEYVNYYYAQLLLETGRPLEAR